MTRREELPVTVERFNRSSIGNHHAWLGFTVTHVQPGRVEAALVIRADQLNPGGGLHGGVTTAFADSLCGYGTHTVLPDGAEGFTTVNLSSQFLGRAGSGERLSGIATLTQGGRRVQTWDVVVSTEKRMVAVVRVTQLLRYRKT